MHRGVGLLAVVVAAAALLAARPAHGQPAGSVQGTVVDEGGGAPLAAAVVTLEELGLSITTGPDGTFSIDDVPAGNYCLTVTREGFAPLTSRVTVTAGVPVHLDLRLPVGEFEERVEVTGVRSELALAEESDSGSRLGLRAIDIPASIDVIASAVMETRGYQRLSDAVETMPGVTAGHNPAAPSSLLLGLTQFRWRRPSRGRSRIPYAGWMRWHYLTGIAFGILTLTWIFSGLLSVQPFAWMTVRGLQVPSGALSGGPLVLADFPPIDRVAWDRASGGRAAKEVSLLRIGGAPYYDVRLARPAPGPAVGRIVATVHRSSRLERHRPLGRRRPDPPRDRPRPVTPAVSACGVQLRQCRRNAAASGFQC